jgi:hypothetical protein
VKAKTEEGLSGPILSVSIPTQRGNPYCLICRKMKQYDPYLVIEVHVRRACELINLGAKVFFLWKCDVICYFR